jgi:4-methylaminobutanoate oxidase (formaldehyde-forming)
VAELPERVQAVVIGGGIVGCSVAYHLAGLGWSVALLERKRLTSGTTWHAAGLVSEAQAVPVMSALAKYGLELFERLPEETGQATGFRRCGSVVLALSALRLDEMRRKLDYAQGCGLRAAEISLAAARERWPLLNVEGAGGAFWFPDDGHVNPIDATMALAKGARQAGATIHENCRVSRVRRAGGKVLGVETERGFVEAATVVNATGIWARAFGQAHGVALPMQGANHYYVVTEPIEGLPPDLPVLRVMDERAYYKADAGKLLIGCSEDDATAWTPAGGIPGDFEFDELPCDEAHLYPILEAALARVPVLAETGIRKFFNGPESFTPDGRYYLGPTPGLEGLWHICGFNSTGIQNGPGAGLALARWIADGRMPLDLTDVDARRIHPGLNASAYVAETAAETLSLAYADHTPFLQRRRARGIRRTPYHDGLLARGAIMGVTLGWERPLFYAPEGPGLTQSFRREPWYDRWQAEALAFRRDLGLIDLTFGRFQIEGADALAAVNRLCSADVDRPPGSLVYTLLLNVDGGIEAEGCLARLSDTAFLLMVSTGAEPQAEAWLRRALAGSGCLVVNVTSTEACLAVMGLRARDFLAPLIDVDLTNARFPFGTFRQGFVGYAPVRAQRLSYVGELGWELHVPSEFAAHLFEVLQDGAEAPRLCGGLAVESARLEKAFRHWGHDIGPFDTPVEAGLGFACDFAKPGGFIGRNAVEARRRQGAAKRLLSFRLSDPEALLFGKEPIWRDGEIVGQVTSASYGWALGAAVALGSVSIPSGASLGELADADYAISVAGNRVPARASLRAFHDPDNQRTRC